MTPQLKLLSDENTPIQPLPLQIAALYGFPLQYHVQADDVLMYAVQDWISGVAQTDKPRKMWDDTKRAFKQASVELSDSIGQLPYHATNGRMYQMDFAADVMLYQITQRLRANTGIRNEVLEFLAKAGAFIDELRQDPESIEEKAASLRQKKAVAAGKDEAWQAAREMGVMTRKQFTAVLVALNPEVNIGRATNDVYVGTLGTNAQGLRKALQIGAKENPRDHLPRLGLIYVMAAEEAARIRLAGYADDDTLPVETIHSTITAIARAVGLQAADMARILGIDLATGKVLLK
jgi:hypothetical protein